MILVVYLGRGIFHPVAVSILLQISFWERMNLSKKVVYFNRSTSRTFSVHGPNRSDIFGPIVTYTRRVPRQRFTTFFSGVPQFGSLRPLPKPDLKQKTKTSTG